jgi:hypothetical protein
MSETLLVIVRLMPHEQRMIGDIARDLGMSEGDAVRMGLGMSPISDTQPPPAAVRRLRLVPCDDPARMTA